jgi:pSer/pThr/pTyr-binding forkhead associated (FHA) protein
MSFLSDFEGRISSVFESAPQGYAEPFSFKKLAKHAARKMESETYRIDGVDTAPALYTVLVSAEDDSLMRPLYERIDYELGEFITESANKKGYALVGRPLVRFMVDESLKSGKFYVDAENVNEQTLARLREEERAFLGGNSSVGGAAAIGRPRRSSAGHLNPIPQPAAPAAAPQPSPSGTDAGLDVMPMDYIEPAGGVIPAMASPSSSTPMPVPYIDASPSQVVAPVAVPVATPVGVTVPPVVKPISPAVQQQAQAVMEATPQPANFPAPAPQPQAVRQAPRAVPDTRRRNAPAAAATPDAARPARPAACMLIDRQSGRTYAAQAPSCLIGRERSQCGIYLRDPNVSRRHAELSYDGSNWHIVDLNSTNGTLVNDVDVDECVLRDGDLITVGLVNLEFRES